MALGVAGQATSVESHAVPGEALLEGHGCVVVLLRVVAGIFLQDGKDAGRGFMPGLPRGDSADRDAHTVAVNRGALARKIHVDEDRPSGRDRWGPDPFTRLQSFGETRELGGRADLG